MNRAKRAMVAFETDAIVQQGGYDVGAHHVDLRHEIDRARRSTHLHLPGADELAAAPPSGRAGAREVTPETTLEAAARLVADGAGAVACLNFASAKHAGGGYRNGSQAQEESLARSSALVACLDEVAEYYRFHQRLGDPIYSDRIICSPDVPVFRADDGHLLDEPFTVTIITTAAPNAGALANRRRGAEVEGAVRQRARCVLAAAAAHGWTTLILGAWGCGVFRNDPVVVADAFGSLLDGEYATAFDLVTFAVLDPAAGAPTRSAFARRLVP